MDLTARYPRTGELLATVKFMVRTLAAPQSARPTLGVGLVVLRGPAGAPYRVRVRRLNGALVHGAGAADRCELLRSPQPSFSASTFAVLRPSASLRSSVPTRMDIVSVVRALPDLVLAPLPGAASEWA